ncbi:hypothetical protein [Ascidiimonas sp. W6]|uniref:hypothetical protein n=1 Tax=Ascidiimonas meishanensis TaxID=3128903 RepID=UPI0030EBB339
MKKIALYILTCVAISFSISSCNTEDRQKLQEVMSNTSKEVELVVEDVVKAQGAIEKTSKEVKATLEEVNINLDVEDIAVDTKLIDETSVDVKTMVEMATEGAAAESKELVEKLALETYKKVHEEGVKTIAKTKVAYDKTKDAVRAAGNN